MHASFPWSSAAFTAVALSSAAFSSDLAAQHPIDEQVVHGFVDSGGVKLHYASVGRGGPLVVMMHGFPDFWYSWRDQMLELAADHHVVAFDLRGYNESDKPKGVDSYRMPRLVEDVAAVISHFGHERAVVVGHDWGGAIAWSFAMARPAMVERLVVLNLPHPRGMMRELAKNPEQRRNSGYARDFQKPDAHRALSATMLAGWVADPAARKRYVAAFERSDFEAMLHYYKANYPSPPKRDPNAATPAATPAAAPPMPKVKPPVLVIHGLEDKYLLAAGLNDTWEWLEQDLTLVTVPKAGHFVQHDASDFVSRTLRMWLLRDGAPPDVSAARRAAINADCPFSGKPVRADSLTRRDGKVVGFCNPECRDKFASAPEKYPAVLELLAR